MKLIQQELQELVGVVLLQALEELIRVAYCFLEYFGRENVLLPVRGPDLSLIPHLMKKLGEVYCYLVIL